MSDAAVQAKTNLSSILGQTLEYALKRIKREEWCTMSLPPFTQCMSLRCSQLCACMGSDSPPQWKPASCAWRYCCMSPSMPCICPTDRNSRVAMRHVETLHSSPLRTAVPRNANATLPAQHTCCPPCNYVGLWATAHLTARPARRPLGK